MRLLVFGSRTWDRMSMVVTLERIEPRPLVVIHGAAKGADTLADLWARGRRIVRERYPVNRDKDGAWPGAGPRRNARMLANGKPDRAIGFVSGRKGEPLSKGSADMAARCRAAGLHVRIIREDGEEQ